jgi:hypothetical protein
MRPSRLMTGMLGAVVLAFGVACGDSESGSGTPAAPVDNGVAELSADEILSKTQQALRDAESVHVKGEGTSDGETFGVDMRFSGSKGATGTLSAEGQTIELLRIGETVYIKADAEFWNSTTGSSAAGELLEGKYLKADSSNENFGELASFTNIASFAEDTLKPEGKVTKGERSTIRGIKTIGLVDAEEGGTLHVATEGEPYPIQIAPKEGGGETGQIDFLDYGAPVELTEPPADQVVDSSKLGN